MTQVKVIIARASDGTYSVYCDDAPTFFGMGETIDKAKADMIESIRMTKEEIGKESALVYPEWLDDEYEFVFQYDVQSFLEYYSGVITPTALGRIAGINPKQVWNYMHGVSKPRKAQVIKIETALHKLGHELINTTF